MSTGAASVRAKLAAVSKTLLLRGSLLHTSSSGMDPLHLAWAPNPNLAPMAPLPLTWILTLLCPDLIALG